MQRHDYLGASISSWQLNLLSKCNWSAAAESRGWPPQQPMALVTASVVLRLVLGVPSALQLLRILLYKRAKASL